jgi:hypothetical protein
MSHTYVYTSIYIKTSSPQGRKCVYTHVTISMKDSEEQNRCSFHSIHHVTFMCYVQNASCVYFLWQSSPEECNLYLCKIWDFHSGNYEECRLLGCGPCRSCVNRRFEGMYLLQLHGRKIHERETSVSRWLQTELSAATCYKLSCLQPPATNWAVCSHLLTLVPRLQIFLPCSWRRYIPSKRRFTQNLHGAASQKTEFFFKLHLTPMLFLLIDDECGLELESRIGQVILVVKRIERYWLLFNFLSIGISKVISKVYFPKNNFSRWIMFVFLLKTFPYDRNQWLSSTLRRKLLCWYKEISREILWHIMDSKYTSRKNFEVLCYIRKL